MGYRLQRAVAQAVLPDLTPTHKAVFRAIADFADDTTGERACPSRQTLANIVGCCPRTVQTALNNLKRIGLLDPYGHSRRYGTVQYRIPIDTLRTFIVNADLPGLLTDGPTALFKACGKVVEKAAQAVGDLSANLCNRVSGERDDRANGCTRSGHSEDPVSKKDLPALARRGFRERVKRGISKICGPKVPRVWLDKAADVRREHGGCPHEAPCEDYGDCITSMALEMRDACG